MNIDGHDIGVCSWSLRPKDTHDLIALVRQLGLSHLQLALGSLAASEQTVRQQELDLIRHSGLTVVAGMVGYPGEDYSTIAAIKKTGGLVPDDQWPQRRQLTLDCGQLAADLGLQLLSGHMGFIPPSSHDAYQTMVGRVAEVAEGLHALGVTLILETGQESAPELLQFLNDVPCRNVGVNFDPANMILYGAGDPIEAIGVLGRHIRHVHVKDALMSDQPGITWGQEVPFGSGQVGPKRFLTALKAAGYHGPLSVEREAGNDRAGDVKRAVETLQQAARA